MDWNEINTLLSVVHMANDVDKWFADQALRRLNEIKANATRPQVQPTARPVISSALSMADQARRA